MQTTKGWIWSALCSLSAACSALGHFTLDVDLTDRGDCCVLTQRIFDEPDVHFVHPQQALRLLCEVTNTSDIRSLSAHSARDTALGALALPPGLTLAPRGSAQVAFDLVAPEEPGDYQRSVTWFAWSSSGILHSMVVEYILSVREFSAELDVPPVINATPGQSLQVAATVRLSEMVADLIGWSVEDEVEGVVSSGQGDPLPNFFTRELAFPTQAPPVSGRFVRSIVLSVFDRLGHSQRFAAEYTIVIAGENFDPDGDGMHNEYEVKNRLNPLVHDAFLDSDGDGHENLKESLFGTRANDGFSRPDIAISQPSPNTLELAWPTVPGKLYHLERATDLGRWSDVLTLTATQPNAAVLLPTATSQRQFHVRAAVP